MSISKKAKELREIAHKCKIGAYASTTNLVGIMNEAADTIEALTAKLKVANMERSADCGGGWIYCGDGRNFPKKSGEYIVMIENATLPTSLHFLNTDNLWFDLDKNYKVVAWREFPEPYHEP